jgi:hypothetical protein
VNPSSPSYFASGLALSSSGTVLAIGAPGGSLGAAFVYRDNGTAYVLEAGPLVGTGYSGNSYQGEKVSISVRSALGICVCACGFA